MADSLSTIKQKLILPFQKITTEGPKFSEVYTEVMENYERLSGEFQRKLSERLRDKFFYLGTMAEHWDEPEGEGEEHKIFNFARAVDDKFSQLLVNGEMPGLEWISPDDDPQNKVFASAAEAVAYRFARDTDFVKQLTYASSNSSVLGDSFFHVYIDPADKRGSKKGTLKMVSLSPFHVMVGWAKNNWEDIQYWIQTSRITTKQAKIDWGLDIDEAEIESEAGSIGATANAPYDDTQVEGVKTHMPMVTLMEYHDKEKDVIVVHNEVVLVNDHNRGSHGLFHIRNRTIPNEPWGVPDHHNIKDENRIYNKASSLALEILKANAAPILVDKGGILGGKKIRARSNLVVTTATPAQGETLEYLTANNLNTFPIEQYLNMVQENIHNLSGMPKAAFGVYQPGSRSGFQLMIQMQPVLLDVKVKQNTEWGPALANMFRYALKLALETKLVTGIPKPVADWDVMVHWGSPLPRDDAKEIQNAQLKLQAGVASRETVMQDLSIQDVTAEQEKIDQETIHNEEIKAEAQAGAMKILQQGQMAQPGMAMTPQATPGQGTPPSPENTHAGEQTVNTQIPAQGGENSVAPTSTY